MSTQDLAPLPAPEKRSTSTPNLTSLLEENPYGWGARTIAYGQFLAERWAADRPVAEWVRELADFENAAAEELSQ